MSKLKLPKDLSYMGCGGCGEFKHEVAISLGEIYLICTGCNSASKITLRPATIDIGWVNGSLGQITEGMNRGKDL